MKRLSSLLVAGTMGLCATIFPVRGDAGYDKIFDKTYSVPMYSNRSIIDNKYVKLMAATDSERERVGFKISVENFKKKNWTEKEKRIPLTLRYTSLLPLEVYVLHPKEVNILGSEQEAYIVPQNERVRLKPEGEAKKPTLILEKGQNLVGRFIGKIGESFGVPFLEQAFDEFIDYSIKIKKRNKENILKSINEGYVATEIPHHFVDKFGGFTETARVYEIIFDMKHAEKEDIPLSLWLKAGFGDPSKKYGELEKIINFSLRGEGLQKIKDSEENIFEKGEIVFSSNKEGFSGREILFKKGGRLIVMDENGRNIKTIIEKEGLSASSPSWSPNGEEILFQAYTKNNGEINNDIYTSDSTGENLRNLTNTPNKQEKNPIWASNGESIIFEEGKEFYIIMRRDNNRIPLVGQEEEIEKLRRKKRISPDGKKIVFQEDTKNGRDIFIKDLRGNKKVNLTNTPRIYEMNPSWSPDGKRVVFECALPGAYNPNICIINSDGRGYDRLTQDNMAYHQDPSFKP